MTLTPIEFAERILNKHAPGQRRKIAPLNLVFLKPSPLHWISVWQWQSSGRAAIPPREWKIGLQLLVQKVHPVQILHHRSESEYATAFRFTNHHELSSYRTSVTQPLLTFNSTVVRGIELGPNTGNLSRVLYNVHYDRSMNAFTSFLHLGNTSLNQGVVQQFHLSQHRNSQLNLHSESGIQTNLLYSRIDDSISQSIQQNFRSTTPTSSSYTYSKSVTLELAKTRTEKADKPPAFQEESRRASELFNPLQPPPQLPSAVPAIDIKRISDEVYQTIERKLKIERQRKGL